MDEELYAAIRDVGDDAKAFAYLHSSEREQAYRDLARLAVEKGPPARVQHMWLPLLREGLIALYDLEDALKFQIDDPLSDLSLDEQRLADFVLHEFQRLHAVNLREDPLALQRVADEACDVAPQLGETGAAEIRLPYLAGLDDGPRHFCARLKQVGSALEVAALLEHVPKAKEFKPRPPDPQEVLLNRLLADFETARGVNLRADDAAMRRLRDAVKTACAELKQHTRAEIKLPYLTAELIEPTHLHVWVTREMLGDAFVPESPEPPKPAPAKPESKLASLIAWFVAIVIIVLVMIGMYLLEL